MIDMVGQIIGRLTVVARDASRTGGQAHWLCRCECGGEVSVNGSNLRRGHTKSCGCYEREQRGSSQRKHGLSASREYTIWRDMIRRCTDPRRRAYRAYGQRGITVCERWSESFENFYADMGPAPTAKHSVDRIDGFLGYFPENCRWATPREQTLNRRGVDDLVEEREKLKAERDTLQLQLAAAQKERDEAIEATMAIHRNAAEGKLACQATLRRLLAEACDIAYQAIEDNAAAMPTTASERVLEIRHEAGLGETGKG